jgi:hypothetical protein
VRIVKHYPAWTEEDGEWRRDFGWLHAEVWPQGGGWPWQVRCVGRDGGLVVARETRICAETESAEAAMVAAEAAVRRLANAINESLKEQR